MFPEDPSRTDMQYFKLRFALMDRDVSYLSTMIITVLESMMHYLEDNWEMLCDDIEHGTINESIACPPQVKEKLMKRIKPMPDRAAELRSEFEKGFDTPIVPESGRTAAGCSAWAQARSRYTRRSWAVTREISRFTTWATALPRILLQCR